MITSRPSLAYKHGLALLERNDEAGAHTAFANGARAGDVFCQYGLGRALLHGIGTDIDCASAVQWLIRASGAGIDDATELLAQIALGNRVLKRDLQMISDAVLAAATNGQASANRALMSMYGDHAQNDSIKRHTSRYQPPSSMICRHLFATKIDVPTAIQVALQPRVSIIDGLLSSSDCDYLISAVNGRWRSSKVFDPQLQESREHPIRTSSDARIDPWQEDVLLRLIQLRLSVAAGCELVCAEPMALLHYKPGQEYRRHFDLLPPDALRNRSPESGQRWRTLCCYLNDVDAGGETEFPAAKLKIAPKRGRAVIFDNISPDGQPDEASEHAGLPVLAGEKFLATLWFRERPIRPY